MYRNKSFSIITIQLEIHVLEINCIFHYKYKYFFCNVNISIIMLQNKKTPLHWASERGHSEVITVLIADGVNVEAQDEVNEYNLN